MQRQLASSALRCVRAPTASVVGVTTRFAGGFNSKFDFEKKWKPEEGESNPFYDYDPHFDNESKVPTHDELDPTSWGVQQDHDVKDTHIIGSWGGVVLLIGGLALFAKNQSKRMYPFFIDEPEINDEAYIYTHGKTYYELRDENYGYANNLRKV